ncbi:MAG: protein kinase [Planctomycetota bacterium]
MPAHDDQAEGTERPPGGESASSHDLLDAIADEYLAARRRGQSPSVDELASRHPSLATEIRELFPVLEMLEVAGEKTLPSPPSPPLPRQLGDYRVLRELGRGGMGIVYEAEQFSLDRRVALKILPGHARLDEHQMRRFLREARAAARLRHPHIVPVFDVGEIDGVHYYAMQLINGRGLDEVLRVLRARRGEAPAPETATAEQESISTELASKLLGVEVSERGSKTSSGGTPSSVWEASSGTVVPAGHRYFFNIARIALQVARALDHAHSEGILHRDLKPSNLLIDRQGTTWVTDFGLAKAEGAETITDTGDVVGTPRYLAPESLRGWSEPRTDVWGLGVTLYELLTLEPAFTGHDRAALLRRIAEENPTAPRRIDPRIPRDLETIVMAALEKEPARRYASAAACADDLQRFLDGRPILARRASWRHRCGLFVRRHRAAVTAAATALFLLTILTTVWAFTLRSARNREATARQELQQSLQSERQARQQAQDQSQRADANFRLALDAVDRMQRRIGSERLAGEPRLEQIRREILEDAVDFYREFLARRGQDPLVRHEAALAWTRLGYVEFTLNHVDEAMHCFDQVRELLRGLARDGSSLKVRAELVGALCYTGRMRFTEGHLEDAEAQLDEALALMAELGDLSTLETAAIVPLVSTHEFAGTLYRSTRRLDQALDLLDKGIELATATLERPSTRSRAEEEHVSHWLHGCLEERARVLRALGRFTDAREDLTRALQIITPLTQRQCADPTFRWALASTLFERAAIDRDTGEAPGLTEEAHRQALSAYESLAEDFPAMPEFRTGRAEVKVFLAVTLQEKGELSAADTLLDEAIADYESLLEETSETTVDRQRQLGAAHIAQGNLYQEQGLLDDAEHAYRAAVEVLEKLQADMPGFVEFERAEASLALAHGNLGGLLIARGAGEEGESLLAESVDRFRALVDANPEHSPHQEKLLLMGMILGRYLRESGRLDEAERILRECRELGAKAIAQAPESPLLLERAAGIHVVLGNLLKRRGLYEEAEQELLASVSLREQLLARAPEQPRALELVAVAENDLGALYCALNRFEEARQLCEKAVQHGRQALSRSTPHRRSSTALVWQTLNLATALEGLGRIEEAAQAAREAALVRAVQPAGLFHAASVLCRYAKVAGEGRAALEDEAMELLRRAIELGFRDRAAIMNEESLATLRERPDFEELLRRLP